MIKVIANLPEAFTHSRIPYQMVGHFIMAIKIASPCSVIAIVSVILERYFVINLFLPPMMFAMASMFALISINFLNFPSY